MRSLRLQNPQRRMNFVSDPASGGPAHVLIVEDEDAVRKMLEDALAQVGYQALSVQDGEEALEWLSRLPVHLVITDLLMPRMGGNELIRRIRQAKQWARLPIILLSGYAELAPYRNLPVEAVCAKPIDLDRLLAEVQRLIGAPPS